MNGLHTHTGPIGHLIAQRRKQLTDDFIEDYDKTENGDKIKEQVVSAPGGGTTTLDTNMTAVLQTAPSTTTRVDILVMEAELVEDGKELDNPHVPLDEDILDKAKGALNAKGLTPAWRHGL